MPATARQRDEHSDLAVEAIGEVTGTETIYLSARDWEAIRVEWENPSEPTPAAVEAARRYRERRQRDVG